MRKQILILIMVMLASAGAATAQLSPDILIQNYETAVGSGDATVVRQAWEALSTSQSAQDYMKVNRPDLYQTYQQGPDVAAGTSTTNPAQYPVGEQALDFPVQDRLDNRDIVNLESNAELISNQEAVENFPNEDLVAQRARLQQLQEQFEGDLGLPALGRDAFVMTVSGISDDMGQALAGTLDQHFGQIGSFMQTGVREGVWFGVFTLDHGNLEDLAWRIEEHQFPSFRLEYLRLDEKRADFVFHIL